MTDWIKRPNLLRKVIAKNNSENSGELYTSFKDGTAPETARMSRTKALRVTSANNNSLKSGSIVSSFGVEVQGDGTAPAAPAFTPWSLPEMTEASDILTITPTEAGSEGNAYNTTNRSQSSYFKAKSGSHPWFVYKFTNPFILKQVTLIRHTSTGKLYGDDWANLTIYGHDEENQRTTLYVNASPEIGAGQELVIPLEENETAYKKYSVYIKPKNDGVVGITYIGLEGLMDG